MTSDEFFKYIGEKKLVNVGEVVRVPIPVPLRMNFDFNYSYTSYQIWEKTEPDRFEMLKTEIRRLNHATGEIDYVD